jgi:hypothetical protein
VREDDAATAVTALVVVRAGGAALQTTLASVSWARRRCVTDPARVLTPASMPEGVEVWAPMQASGWILLLAEGECATDGLAGALRAIMREEPNAYRVAVECRGFGGGIRLLGRPVRLMRAAAPAIGVALGGELGFVAPRGAPVLAQVTIERPVGALPTEAVDALNADATVLAALAAAGGVRPRYRRLVASGIIGSARVLGGAGRGRLGWGRWILAVLAGYRGLLVEAKLWERAQREGPWLPS